MYRFNFMGFTGTWHLPFQNCSNLMKSSKMIYLTLNSVRAAQPSYKVQAALLKGWFYSCSWTVEIWYVFVIDVHVLAYRLRKCLAICVSANMWVGLHPEANCIPNFLISNLPVRSFLDNLFPDAAITMGMVLLNEAATSKGDVGKRRSK